MSELVLQKNLKDFLKENRAKICALTLSLSFFSLVSGCVQTSKMIERKTQKEIISHISEYPAIDLLNLKQRLIETSDDISSVTEDEDNYYITINKYERMPVYSVNEEGVQYIIGYSVQCTDIDYYYITKRTANNFGLDEYLNKFLNNYQKTK